MHELFVERLDRLAVLEVCLEFGAPLGRDRLREDVLDRRLFDVDLFARVDGLADPLEDELLLRAEPAEVERLGADGIADLLVGREVLPPRREVVEQHAVDRTVVQLAARLQDRPVQTLSRTPPMVRRTM